MLDAIMHPGEIQEELIVRWNHVTKHGKIERKAWIGSLFSIVLLIMILASYYGMGWLKVKRENYWSGKALSMMFPCAYWVRLNIFQKLFFSILDLHGQIYIVLATITSSRSSRNFSLFFKVLHNLSVFRTYHAKEKNVMLEEWCG